MGCSLAKPQVTETSDSVATKLCRPSQDGLHNKPSTHIQVEANDRFTNLAVPGAHVKQQQDRSNSFEAEHRSLSKSRSPGRAAVSTRGDDTSPQKRERRVGYGTEGVREQIKKMAIGGTAGEKEDFYAVSSSESDRSDLDSEGERSTSYSGPGTVVLEADPTEEADMIARGLERSFIFRGIDKRRLNGIIQAMVLLQVPAGETVIHQGALPQESDCIYLLASGEVDIVIAGGGAQKMANEDRLVEGNTVRIHKQTGWLFGDVALLFNSQRSASIVTTTDATLWALNRRAFLKFVLRHAPGARTLRFVRRIPLLKGLSDNVLLEVAARMTEESFKDGRHLIRMGEQGTKLFLIRSGKVCVQLPSTQPDLPAKTLAVLGRGHFVGERTLITGKLRTADCIAVGDVEAVVMSKREFQDLDNPLLAWMIDYDAVATVLKGLKSVQQVSSEELEQLFDSFERTEHARGEVICRQGQSPAHLGILRLGELTTTTKKAKPLKETGGFAYYGEDPTKDGQPANATVVVASETAVILTIPHARILEVLAKSKPLGDPSQDPAAAQTIAATLKRCQILAGMSETELGSLAKCMAMSVYQPGEVIAPASLMDNKLFFIARGAALSTSGPLSIVPGTSKVALAGLTGDVLNAGTVEGQSALIVAGQGLRRRSSLVAYSPDTQVFVLTRKAADECFGGSIAELLQHRDGAVSMQQTKTRDLDALNVTANQIEFQDLNLGRIIGAGQFGLVRIVQHKQTKEVYALKVMHKSPLNDGKQVEHIVNERKILGAANHPFCVRLMRALQDTDELYLLQEWIGGGELFHYLDVEGSFTDSAARFYTANVLLALQHLHSKGILYRDLKPENLLLDKDGYVKVADFGFAKIIGREKTYTICGTPDYQAPEIIMRKGTGVAADYWALGILVFEMLVGDPPFKSLSGDPWDTFRRTLSGRFFVPPSISSAAADLIYKLLQLNPDERLGSGPKGAEEIRQHHWFTGFDWDAMLQRKMRAPILPRLKDKLDTSNFDNFEEGDLPPSAPGRTDRFADRWEGLWDWIDEPHKK